MAMAEWLMADGSLTEPSTIAIQPSAISHLDQPPIDRLHPSIRLLERAFCPYDEIGARGLVLGRPLRRQPLARLRLRHPTRDEPRDLHRRGARRHDDTVEVLPVPGLEQQRHIDHG